MSITELFVTGVHATLATIGFRFARREYTTLGLGTGWVHLRFRLRPNAQDILVSKAAVQFTNTTQEIYIQNVTDYESPKSTCPLTTISSKQSSANFRS
jgi:hypothetical protein